VLDLFAALHRDRGLTLVVVTHSPEVAARAGRTLWLRDGRLASPGDAPLGCPRTGGQNLG
jgi:putative ABC transport system ATP-binding protein